VLSIVGIIFGLACIFGSFIVGGGSMAPIWHALPLEGTAILGSAIGGLITANSMTIVKGTLAGLGKILKGPAFKKQDYMDTIFLVAKIMKVLKAEGAVALESHVEAPE
jgi:chemotaxis protein MotA